MNTVWKMGGDGFQKEQEGKADSAPELSESDAISDRTRSLVKEFGFRPKQKANIVTPTSISILVQRYSDESKDGNLGASNSHLGV